MHVHKCRSTAPLHDRCVQSSSVLSWLSRCIKHCCGRYLLVGCLGLADRASVGTITHAVQRDLSRPAHRYPPSEPPIQLTEAHATAGVHPTRSHSPPSEAHMFFPALHRGAQTVITLTRVTNWFQKLRYLGALTTVDAWPRCWLPEGRPCSHLPSTPQHRVLRAAPQEVSNLRHTDCLTLTTDKPRPI
jgi:hypothetical protein